MKRRNRWVWLFSGSSAHKRPLPCWVPPLPSHIKAAWPVLRSARISVRQLIVCWEVAFLQKPKSWERSQKENPSGWRLRRPTAKNTNWLGVSHRHGPVPAFSPKRSRQSSVAEASLSYSSGFSGTWGSGHYNLSSSEEEEFQGPDKG